MQNNKKYLIIDCFVDEPACFGVPPFIAPYPRYIYGALVEAGILESQITYLTIDSLRESEYKLNDNYEISFIIGGAVVPGKYLGSKIGTATEIDKILTFNQKHKFAIGGMIAHVIKSEQKNNFIITEDIEKFAHNFTLGKKRDQKRTVDEIDRWSKFGANVVKQHPNFPNIICEMETSRGCPRKQHCSFCSEGLFKGIEFREIDGIITEIDELIKLGISRFRIGRQADIIQYKTAFSEFKNGFSKPNITSAVELFSELKIRKDSGFIKILNVDNANPGTIINYPNESSKILEAIVDAITPGDTLPLGIESFDQNVAKANNLKVTGDEAIKVIQIINEIGGKRVDGIPVLLPGINLIHGLKGETANTFKENFLWLEKILNQDLLLKRINIRKLHPFPGTAIINSLPIMSQKTINRFEYYRDKIRNEIDLPMVKKIYPTGTILKDNMILSKQNGYSYGKQLSSYSITMKIPLELTPNNLCDAIVVGHRERSLIGIPTPIKINEINQKAIESIPGISKKLSSTIILKRPFKNSEELKIIAPNINDAIIKKIVY